MSSYLNIYVRVRSDLYKIERIKDTEYQKQEDVILFDSYSRNSKMYQIVRDAVNPVWDGDEEKYSVLDEISILKCMQECKKYIKNIETTINNYKSRKSDYIKYLQGRSDVLTYEEFLDAVNDIPSHLEEYEVDLTLYNDCLNQLFFIKDFIHTCSLNCNGFSEVLCNID